MPSADAARNRRDMILDRVGLDQPRRGHEFQRLVQRDEAAGDRGGARAAVGLQHVAIDHDLPLAKAARSVTARNERPIRRWISCVRPDCLPDRGLAPHALAGGARQHAVFRRHPAAPRAAQERRRRVLDAGGAQHMGVAELDQARTLGVLEHAGFEADTRAFGRNGRWSGHRIPLKFGIAAVTYARARLSCKPPPRSFIIN